MSKSRAGLAGSKALTVTRSRTLVWDGSFPHEACQAVPVLVRFFREAEPVGCVVDRCIDRETGR